MKPRLKKTRVVVVLLVLLVLLTPGVSYGFFNVGGYDVGIQLKMLAEMIEHTLHLKEIIAFTKKQVGDIKKTLQIVKEVNRDINEIKNYDLDQLSGDLFDVTVGGVSDDIDNLSDYIADKRFIDGQGSGRIKNFFRYVWGEEPTEENSPIKVKLLANNYFAVKSFEDINQSYDFTYNIRKLYKNIVDDVKDASPGESEQIGAQLEAVNILQLSKLQDNQAGLLKLKAVDLMNRTSEARQAQQQTVYMFGGVANAFKKMKEEREE